MNVSINHTMTVTLCGPVESTSSRSLSKNSNTTATLTRSISLVLSSINVISVQTTSKDLKQQHTPYICTDSGNNSLMWIPVGKVLTNTRYAKVILLSLTLVHLTMMSIFPRLLLHYFPDTIEDNLLILKTYVCSVSICRI